MEIFSQTKRHIGRDGDFFTVNFFVDGRRLFAGIVAHHFRGPACGSQ